MPHYFVTFKPTWSKTDKTMWVEANDAAEARKRVGAPADCFAREDDVPDRTRQIIETVRAYKAQKRAGR